MLPAILSAVGTGSRIGAIAAKTIPVPVAVLAAAAAVGGYLWISRLSWKAKALEAQVSMEGWVSPSSGQPVALEGWTQPQRFSYRRRTGKVGYLQLNKIAAVPNALIINYLPENEAHWEERI